MVRRNDIVRYCRKRLRLCVQARGQVWLCPAQSSLSIQALFWFMSCCSSACESFVVPFIASIQQHVSILILCVHLVLVLVLLVDSFCVFRTTTNERPGLGQIILRSVALPNVQTRYLRCPGKLRSSPFAAPQFRHADLAAEFRNFISKLVDGIDTNVINDWLLRMFTSLERSVWSVVRATSIDM
jgi:hypothetical protein